ncbi:hypothetical protein [Streptomyces sp. NPDC007172]|uniref:hypothetical protein n=1 Tax=Streptomyces sp. NPDC007172 TaxID=3364776 RepID=UPI00368E40F3
MRNAKFRGTFPGLFRGPLRGPFRGRRIAAAVLAATAVLTVTASSAFADATPASSAKPPASDGAKGICKHEPKTEKRVERALKRLDGGAGTVGSVARMRGREDAAKKAGHSAVAMYLGHRLASREGRVTGLQQRERDLKAVAAWCAAQ